MATSYLEKYGRANMKTICFVLSASNTKGANGALLELISGLDRNIFTPVVLIPNSGPIERELTEKNIRFRVINYKWWVHAPNFPNYKKLARLIFNIFTLPLICSQMIKWRVDIIYTNTIAISSGLFAAIILNKPHVFHIHEFGDLDHKLIFDFGRRTSLWLANSFSKRFIFVSYACLNHYRGFIENKKSAVIYQSVTLPTLDKHFLPRNVFKHKLQCVIVGRLHENKGQKEALEAVNILMDQGLDVGLWIVGEGDLRYEHLLKEIVRKRNIENHVVFLGWQDNPFLIIEDADVFLMCSKNEAFGRVTVETMLMARPVIGLRSGGTSEIIQEGFSGLLYDQSNYKNLAEKIYIFYQHPDLIQKIGVNGRKAAMERFTQAHYVDSVSAILRDL